MIRAAIPLGPRLLQVGGLGGTGIITVPASGVITCSKARDLRPESILERVNFEIEADLAL
jgi:hypothetical protein